MDPLSITAGVATLLGCCISVGVSLRKLLIGASEAKVAIAAMLADLRALRSVLESMEVTFEEMNSDKPGTGHVGTHWTNLSQSLVDCQQSLNGLQLALDGVNKDVGFLDSTRKQMRIKAAADKIVLCRQEVQAYRDALQLSLQTIILWNTTNAQGKSDEILLTSKATHQDLQQLATNVEVKLTALQTMFEQSHQANNAAKITNLKRTITSAATVIAGDSTDIANLEDVNDLMSDFGDWFRSEIPQHTLDWVNERSNETFSMPDRPGFYLLNERSAAHRDMPVHSRSKSELAPVKSLDSATRLEGESESRQTGELSSRSSAPALHPSLSPHSPAPTGIPRRKPVGGHSPKNVEVSSSAQNQHDEGSDPATPVTNSKPDSPPPAQPSDAVQTGTISGKRSRRRFRWFRFRSTSNPVLSRSPMIGDPGSQSSRWLKPKLPRKLKIVLVGDGASGKTCLLILVTKGTFPEVYVPTVFENYVADYEVDKQHYTVHFWDTAGQEDYDGLRPLSYPDADAIIITFAIDGPDSLDNVQEKWIHEVLHFASATPIFLVGCKEDLRNDSATIQELAKTSQKPVSAIMAENVRRKIGAVAYLETSAKTGKGAYQALEIILRKTVQYRIGQARR